MDKPNDWFTLAQIKQRYPELYRAVRSVYDRHPSPGSEPLVRIPDLASGLVGEVKREWGKQTGKDPAMFPFMGWAVIFCWVKIRKQPNQR